MTGTVLWDGAPLEGGWIYFRPLGKGPSSAAEIHHGEFKTPAAKGLLPGTYQVAIEYRKRTGKQIKVYTGEMIEEEQQIIPPRYNQQTTLTIEVQAKGPNHVTFELESER